MKATRPGEWELNIKRMDRKFVETVRRLAAAERLGKPLEVPPVHTAMGALVEHITGGHLEGPGGISKFQPMNINYGLLPPLEAPKVDEAGVKIPMKERGRAKKRLMSVRAIKALKAWRDAG
mgnify:CR=1 FL=1